MSRNHTSKPLKSCIFLHARTYDIPPQILRLRPVRGSVIRSIKIGFLEDEFELYVVRVTNVILRAVFYRNRRYPKRKPDDGYVLQFNFLMIRLNEGTKVVFMKHDDEKTGVTFMLSKAFLAEAINTSVPLELFVVVQMLEFKSIHKNYNHNDNCKRKIDSFMSYLKSNLPEEDMRHLCYILRSPGLEDTFTGRLPPKRMHWIPYIISVAAINLSKVAKYMSEKSKVGPDKIPNVDINWLLSYINHGNKETQLSFKDAIIQKYRAHIIGLDFYKTITTDYLLKIMDEDHVVLDILLLALFVQDEYLFGKAAIAYVNRYHEISNTMEFQHYVLCQKQFMRLITHAVRIWRTRNACRSVIGTARPSTSKS